MRAKNAIAWSVLAAVLMEAKHAVAQGCLSCYTTTAAGGTQTVHALRNGIVVLLIPPALMFVGLMVVLRRWRSEIQPNRKVPDRNEPMDFPDVL